MKVKYKSHFKSPASDREWFRDWVKRLEQENGRSYQEITLHTSLGKTKVYGINTDTNLEESIVIFPGARTTSLFWDLDNNLATLREDFKIFLVETNGLPNLSSGQTPDIHGNGYGEWATEILDQLNLNRVFVAGASFGGLICMKLCITSSERVKGVFLLNPGCLQPFSLKPRNLLYNLLPIISPSKKNIHAFLDKAIFNKPFHAVDQPYEELMVDYEHFALTRFVDRTQKPYYMAEELGLVKNDIYILLGDKDLLFPHRKSIENASRWIPNLRDVVVLANVGHGIETTKNAMKYISRWASQIAAKEKPTFHSVL
ncbi:MAG: alpha/beta fold hydrolase [Cyclobacteriaceae bacterium]